MPLNVGDILQHVYTWLLVRIGGLFWRVFSHTLVEALLNTLLDNKIVFHVQNLAVMQVFSGWQVFMFSFPDLFFLGREGVENTLPGNKGCA